MLDHILLISVRYVMKIYSYNKLLVPGKYDIVCHFEELSKWHISFEIDVCTKESALHGWKLKLSFSLHLLSMWTKWISFEWRYHHIGVKIYTTPTKVGLVYRIHFVLLSVHLLCCLSCPSLDSIFFETQVKFWNFNILYSSCHWLQVLIFVIKHNLLISFRFFYTHILT